MDTAKTRRGLSDKTHAATTIVKLEAGKKALLSTRTMYDHSTVFESFQIRKFNIASPQWRVVQLYFL
jgi:hypothetical protein